MTASEYRVLTRLFSYCVSVAAIGFVSVETSLSQQQSNRIVLPLIDSSRANPGSELKISVVKVGNRDVNIPLLLDTGSASISIDCREIFPEAACTDKGVDPIAVQGTSIRLTDSIGKSNFEETVEHHQLAYATLSMGTKVIQVKTETEVPFFIRYKETDRASGKTKRTQHKGVFGISPVDATKQREGEISVLRAVDPGQGLRRGYILRAAVGKSDSCAERFIDCEQLPTLQVGIAPDDGKNFLISKVTRPAPRWPFATVDACLTFGKQQVCKPTLFDTGSPKSIIAGKSPGASKPLSTKQVVAVEGEAFEPFSFKPSKSRRVVFNPQLPFNVIGIVYFANHDYLVDFERNEIGFERTK